MKNVREGGEVRQPRRAPETSFEFKVDEWAAGIQSVRHGVLDIFFIHISEDEGVTITPDNVEEALFAVTRQAADLGIQLTRQRGLDEPYVAGPQPLDMDTILANPPESTRSESPDGDA